MSRALLQHAQIDVDRAVQRLQHPLAVGLRIERGAGRRVGEDELQREVPGGVRRRVGVVGEQPGVVPPPVA